MDGRQRRAEGCAAAVKEAAVFAFRSGSGEERKEASESGAGSGSMKEGTVSGAAAPADSVARLSLRGRGHWEDRDAGCGNRGPRLLRLQGGAAPGARALTQKVLLTGHQQRRRQTPRASQLLSPS